MIEKIEWPEERVHTHTPPRVFVCTKKSCGGRILSRHEGDRKFVCPLCKCFRRETPMVEVFKR